MPRAAKSLGMTQSSVSRISPA
ncbi:hypothetical protein ACF1BQ_029635 [Bradyrhizobium sp. RDT10]